MYWFFETKFLKVVIIFSLFSSFGEGYGHFYFTKAKTNTQTKRNNPLWKVYLFHIKLFYVLLHCPCSNPWLVCLYICCFDSLCDDHVPTGYSAIVAMPQLFPLFLLINMYPSIPQSTPATKRHLFLFSSDKCVYQMSYAAECLVGYMISGWDDLIFNRLIDLMLLWNTRDYFYQYWEVS